MTFSLIKGAITSVLCRSTMSFQTWQRSPTFRWSHTRSWFKGFGAPRAWIAADILPIEDGKVAEHWDVLQDEVTQAESVSGLPMFGNTFPSS